MRLVFRDNAVGCDPAAGDERNGSPVGRSVRAPPSGSNSYWSPGFAVTISRSENSRCTRSKLPPQVISVSV